MFEHPKPWIEKGFAASGDMTKTASVHMFLSAQVGELVSSAHRERKSAKKLNAKSYTLNPQTPTP